jgi:catechol 2,3-dioxygenase-like lactoylglutathione lyase family enzyme
MRVADLEASVEFAERILGLRVSERDGDTVYLTCNTRHHELVLIDAEAAACDHVAFEAFDAAELERLRGVLNERGVTILDERCARGVADSLRFVAPGGFVVEVFHGMATDQPPHYDTVGVRPRKFEHVTVKSSVKDELEAFLGEVLGLRVSDRAEDQITWMRVSDEHHGVSVIGADVDQLHHYAWQVSWEDIRRAGDKLLLHDREFLWGPGHHGIGDNYFSYFYDPAGAVVEYSADIQRIEDDAAYRPRTWPDEPRTVNRWGNPEPPAEFFGAGIPIAVRAVTAGV